MEAASPGLSLATQSGVTEVITILSVGCVLSTVVVTLRLATRLWVMHAFWWDDGLMGFAQVLCSTRLRSVQRFDLPFLISPAPCGWFGNSYRSWYGLFRTYYRFLLIDVSYHDTETKWGLGRHVWTIQPEETVPYLKVP